MVRAVFAIPGDITTPTGGYAYDREVLARLPGLGVTARHLALPVGFPFPDQAALAETRRVLAGCPPDEVLLIDGLAYGALPVDLIGAIRSPVVALVHHPLGHETGLDAATAAGFVARERAALAMARRVIVTSPATARLLADEFEVAAAGIAVAVPGTAKAARATGSGGHGPVHLLAVGAISRRKGYGVLIDALASLREHPWTLTIAGASDRAPDVAAEIRQRINTTGLSNRIRMVGGVGSAELDQLYANADLFLMPSLYEGYGMVLAEAMARGLPVVCTTGGAAAETVPDAAAIKVPPGDVTSFAAAVRLLLDEPRSRSRLAAASWTAGQHLPGWEDTAAIIARVLNEVAR